MAKKQRKGTAPKMSNAAVQAATGKGWTQWFSLLDKAGAMNMDHQSIVALLVKKHGIRPWWQQMVAVAYEQARGLRQVHQTTRGYSISRSRTLPAPVTKVFRAWKDPATRRRWLKDHQFTIRKATPGRSMRITWVDGSTSLEVNFYLKGPVRSQVTVQHSKLPDAKSAARMKAYWTRQLDRLVTMLRPDRARAMQR